MALMKNVELTNQGSNRESDDSDMIVPSAYVGSMWVDLLLGMASQLSQNSLFRLF